jgi:hypothetical protein
VETVPPALPSIPPQEEATRPTLPLPKPPEVPQTYEIQLGRFGDHQERVTLSQVGQQLKAVHATDVVNKFWGNTTSYQHPITKFRACSLGDFERKNCVTAEGDILTLAEGLTPYDVILDLQFNENGQAIYRSFRAVQGGNPVLFETLPF